MDDSKGDMPPETEAYTYASIIPLEGLEPVRRRPAMYIGDTRDGSGLEHLVWEVVANALDQHLARRARNLRVDVAHDGTVTVEDDGPGIPVAPTPGGRPALEIVFGQLHHGATWGGHTPHVHVAPSLHGVGVAVVAALSARLEVDSRHDGAHWRAVFERGYVIQPASRCGAAARSGTRVRFRPDPAVFSGAGLPVDRLERRLRELAWLNPLLAIRFQGAVLPGSGGLAGWVRSESGGALVGDTVLATSTAVDGAYVDLAFAWSPARTTRIASFVNQTPTIGGTHVAGLRAGLVRIARSFGCTASANVVRELLGPGLIAAVHVGLHAPDLGSPRHDRLRSPIARKVVRRAVMMTAATIERRHSALAVFLRERLRT